MVNEGEEVNDESDDESNGDENKKCASHQTSARYFNC